MLAAKYFYVACKLFAVLALQDFAPGDAWVCRPSQSPAGFDFVYVTQVKSGDLQVQYEDQCEAAITLASANDI
jgi:hypothetical protein